MNELNLTPLKTPTSKEEIRLKRSYLKHRYVNLRAKHVYKVNPYLAAAGVILMVISQHLLFAEMSFMESHLTQYRLLGIGTYAGFIYITFIKAIKIYPSPSDLEIRMLKFLEVNNIAQAPYDSRPEQDKYKGFIFKQGIKPQISDHYIFGDNFTLGLFTADKGPILPGNYTNWTWLRIELKKHVPNLFLDSKKNNLAGKISDLDLAINKSQIISLEGDFNKYFTLYAPAEYSTEALYIFTPDVMQNLIEANNKYPFDMEVIDNHLYIYTKGIMDYRIHDEWKALMTIVQTILPKLEKQTKNYSDDNPYYINSTNSNMSHSRLILDWKSPSRLIAFAAISIWILAIIWPVIDLVINNTKNYFGLH